MTDTLFPPPTRFQEGLAALRRDLIHADGPSISTIRNYRFAIVAYPPKDEFLLRRDVRSLSSELRASGWMVLPIDLHALFLDRLRAQGPEWIDRIIEVEKQLASHAPARALKHLVDKLARLVEGPDGIAADCSRLICDHADRHPDLVDRTLALIGRAGGLYPFYRSSALLRHLDGRTRNVPVVLLYPGKRNGQTGLSFMERLTPDKDYRPRIYP